MAPDIHEILVNAGLLGAFPTPSIESLGGGVSSDVHRVEAGPDRFVVKQALNRFRVRDEWHVDPRRSEVEAAFSAFIREELGAGLVPRVVHVDADRHLLVMEAAPPAFGPWKARLLEGRVEPRVADGLGRFLGRLHARSSGRQDLRRRFANEDLFHQQRLDPYFRATAARVPRHRAELLRLERWLREGGSAVIHGDASPKNVLTDGERLLLVDHEVATWGRPAFDVAFLLNHLLLKSLHLPALDARLRAAGLAFLCAYSAENRLPREEAERLPRLLGALMLARVNGKSPVEYLDEGGRARAKAAAGELLERPFGSAEEVLDAWPI